MGSLYLYLIFRCGGSPDVAIFRRSRQKSIIFGATGPSAAGTKWSGNSGNLGVEIIGHITLKTGEYENYEKFRAMWIFSRDSKTPDSGSELVESKYRIGY